MVLQDSKIRKRHQGISLPVTCKMFRITNSNCKEVKTNFSMPIMVLKKYLFHKKMSYNICKSSTNIVLDSKQLFPKHSSEQAGSFGIYM